MAREQQQRLGMTAILAVLLGLLAVLAIRSGGASGRAIPQSDHDFDIVMREGSIELEAASLAPGKQVVEVLNDGRGQHEVVVVRTDLAADELPVGLHGVSIALATEHGGKLVIGEDHLGLGHVHRIGAITGQLSGDRNRYQVSLRPGHYVVYCQIASHYLVDEYAEFTVE